MEETRGNKTYDIKDLNAENFMEYFVEMANRPMAAPEELSFYLTLFTKAGIVLPSNDDGDGVERLKAMVSEKITDELIDEVRSEVFGNDN